MPKQILGITLMIIQNIFRRKVQNSTPQEPGMDYNANTGLRKKALGILRALNHPARRQILQVLHQYGRMGISEICKKLHLEDFAASQHLAILLATEFVTLDGNTKMYSVNYNKVKEANLVNKQLRN
jgi:DNA-binding transcriptional ArsR family regulator